MRALVTGGHGYIGSVLVEALLARGDQVVIVDNHSTSFAGKDFRGVSYDMKTDIRDKPTLAFAFTRFRPDIVYHLAAEALIESSPGATFENNVVGSLEVLHAMERVGCKKIVFASSAAVYGSAHCGRIDEMVRCAPISPYGESKLQTERMLYWYGQQMGFKYAALRLFNVCGATATRGEHRRNENHIIPRVYFHGNTGGKFQMMGNAIRDYIHVSDVAKAFMWAGENLTNEIYNVCSGEGTSNRDVLEVVRDVTGWYVQMEEAQPRIGDPPRLVGDPRKLVGAGFKFEHFHFPEMVKDAVEWYRRKR